MFFFQGARVNCVNYSFGTTTTGHACALAHFANKTVCTQSPCRGVPRAGGCRRDFSWSFWCSEMCFMFGWSKGPVRVVAQDKSASSSTGRTLSSCGSSFSHRGVRGALRTSIIVLFSKQNSLDFDSTECGVLWVSFVCGRTERCEGVEHKLLCVVQRAAIRRLRYDECGDPMCRIRDVLILAGSFLPGRRSFVL